MVGVSPMPNGRFDQPTQDALRWVGRWLKMNGEAIYRTRGFFGEDSSFAFTRSKDSSTVYAIHKGLFRDRKARIHHLRARPGSRITLLGREGALPWKQEGEDVLIGLPAQRPACEYAYVLKIRIQQ
jgi:alpha-L-fucosidase